MRARLAGIVAVLLLAGCREQSPEGDEILTCSAYGQVTFQARAWFWKTDDSGTWRGGRTATQYKPSLVESCSVRAVK